VSASFFELMGTTPFLGSGFNDASWSARPKPAILSYQLWRRRFSADPNIVGQLITIPGTAPDAPWVVAGIMPKGFDFPNGANFWVPYDPRFESHTLTPRYARLTPGTSIEAVRAALHGASVTRLRDQLQPSDAIALLYLNGAGLLLLLIAWVHAGTLLVSNTSAQLAEVGVRMALGATPFRITTEFVIRGLIVGVLSLSIAWALAPSLLIAVVQLLPKEMPTEPLLRFTGKIILASVVVIVGSVALLLTVTAFYITRAHPVPLVRAQGVAGRLRVSTRGRAAALSAQIAVAMSLVYVAVLAHQSYRRASTEDLGFRAAGLFVVPVPLPIVVPGMSLEARRAEEDRNATLARETVEALEVLLGLQGVSFAGSPPIGPHGSTTVVSFGQQPGVEVEVFRVPISPGYPQVIGARIVAGQEPSAEALSAADALGAAVRPALVNERLARQLSGQDVVGSRLWVSRTLAYEIVGIISDVKQSGVDEPVLPIVYPYLRRDAYTPLLLVRLGSQDAGHKIVEAMKAIWGARASNTVLELGAAAQQLTAKHQARSYVLGGTTLLCLPIMMLGIIGAVIHWYDRRSDELVLRQLLGATPGWVKRHAATAILRACAAGVVAGLAIGFGFGRIASHVLYNTAPVNGSALAVGIGALLTLTSVAAFIGMLVGHRRLSPTELRWIPNK
jgi:putative ABC transport system permease protein